MRKNLPVNETGYMLREGMTMVSRTDPKSRISHVNEDFVEASGFAEPELIGQPHNLVRHPDMPEAVFSDMWETLQSGQPWSGLLKNRRKNGDHYWVAATITPIMEGERVAAYVSVRTPPTREQIDLAAKTYALMREGDGKQPFDSEHLIARAGSSGPGSRLLGVPTGHMVPALIGTGVLALALSAAGGIWRAWWLLALAAILSGAAAWAGLAWMRGLRSGVAHAATMARQFSQGRFDGLLQASGVHELSGLMRALRSVQVRLGFEITDTARRSGEADRIRGALDLASSPMMVTDADLNIVYINPALGSCLARAEQEVRQGLPQFDSAGLVGSSLRSLFPHPADQRSLQALSSGEATLQMVLGNVGFDLHARPLSGAGGKRLGLAIEWRQPEMPMPLACEGVVSDEKAHADDEALRVRQALDAASLPVRIADPQGTIVYVNPAMSAILKRDAAAFRRNNPDFDPERIVGRSVGIFYADPAAAVQRLSRLGARQETQMTLGGRHYLVTTTPIIDAAGRQRGTVGQWVDRTEQLQAETELSSIISASLAGDLSGRIDVQGKTGFFKTVGESLNGLLARLSSVLHDVNGAAQALTLASSQVSSTSQALSQAASEQAAGVERTAASLQQMAASVKQNAESANVTDGMAAQAAGKAVEGGDAVSKTLDAMKAIAAKISIINDIAYQTNLLALNAARLPHRKSAAWPAPASRRPSRPARC